MSYKSGPFQENKIIFHFASVIQNDELLQIRPVWSECNHYDQIINHILIAGATVQRLKGKLMCHQNSIF